MGITNLHIEDSKEAELNLFDAYSYMAWGDGTAAEAPTDTTLDNEIIRKLFDEPSTKNIGAGTYSFKGRLSLSEANGTTLSEIGIFDAVSGGKMPIRKLLPVPKAKTSDIEIAARLKVTITVIEV